MAKPIFVIYVPNIINDEKRVSLSNKLKSELSDWHVLVIADSITTVKCEAFSDTPMQLLPDNLKEQLEAVLP